jgi:uncharacterized RDD family membrane protein YckC
LRQAAQAVAPAWKEEVNRRIAEHKGRKANPGEAQQQPEPQPAPGSLAAKAAARVAARYAKAPSYSEMLADEARAAVRAAEAASKAALEAQAAAESLLAGLEAASTAQNWEPEFSAAPDRLTPSEPQWTPEPVLVPQRAMAAAAPLASASAPLAAASLAATPATKPAVQKKASRKQAPNEEAPAPQAFEIRWDSDLPVREVSVPGYPSHGERVFAQPAQHEWEAPQMHEGFGSRAYEVVEPAQPIHANLIEFPRELVATRKLRPRRAEGPYAEQVEAERQLSIFEVEPWTISTEPEATGSAAEAAPNWVGPEWSGIELDEEPLVDPYAPAPNYAAAYAEVHAGVQNAVWDRTEAPAQQANAAEKALPLAPLGSRMLAGLVDFSLIAGAFVCAALLASLTAKTMPPLKQMALESVFAFALTAAFYLAIFFTLSTGTPGMKYASLEIRTFGGQRPTRGQRFQRMMTLLVSLAPVGLGAVWAVFDEQHLCWHDRLSGTYVRKG